MTFSLSSIVVGSLLMLVQVLAALPWVALVFLNPDEIAALFRAMKQTGTYGARLLLRIGIALVVAVIAGIAALALERSALETVGKVYGAVLQLQLTIDFFIVAFIVLLRVWPKGGAVAQAAFR